MLKEKRTRDEILIEWNIYKDYINKLEFGAWIDINQVYEIAKKKGKLND